MLISGMISHHIKVYGAKFEHLSQSIVSVLRHQTIFLASTMRISLLNVLHEYTLKECSGLRWWATEISALLMRDRVRHDFGTTPGLQIRPKICWDPAIGQKNQR
jgi:hypothetical protein